MAVRTTALTITVGASQQLSMARGEDRQFVLTFQDGSPLAPVDFTGATSIILTIKSRPTGLLVLARSYSGFQGQPTAGTPIFLISQSDTQNEPEGPYDVDVTWTDALGNKEQLLVASTFLLLKRVGAPGDAVTTPPAVPVVYGLNWLPGSWSTPTGGYNVNDAVDALDGSLGATAISSFRAISLGVTYYPVTGTSQVLSSGWAYVGQHGGAGATGPQGSTGATGPTGPQGTTGVLGPTLTNVLVVPNWQATGGSQATGIGAYWQTNVQDGASSIGFVWEAGASLISNGSRIGELRTGQVPFFGFSPFGAQWILSSAKRPTIFGDGTSAWVTLSNAAGTAIGYTSNFVSFNVVVSGIEFWLGSTRYWQMVSSQFQAATDSTGTIGASGFAPQLVGAYWHDSRLGAQIVATSTIKPTAALHHVTGTSAISTIDASNVPPGSNVQLTLVADGASGIRYTTGGNIGSTGVIAQNRYQTMWFDWSASKWYPPEGGAYGPSGGIF